MGARDDLEQQQPLRHEKPDFDGDDDDFRASGSSVSSSSSSSSSLPVRSSSSYSLHPLFYIGSWIFFSNTTILFNKWLIDTKGFRYPVILTCWHLIFATIATQLLARTTTLLDSRHTVKMTGRIYLRAIVPVGLFYSASLVCSNMVYLYLSVAFIQMLKAAAPVAVLFVAWAWGVENPSLQKLINILVIVAGVSLASFGEIAFSWAGFLYQLGGIVFEAMRLVMIQVLLSDDRGAQKMDPLVSLYYYAPVCAVMNILVAMATEAFRFDFADLGRTGYGLLLLNAGVAFMLNVSSVFLVSFSLPFSFHCVWKTGKLTKHDNKDRKNFKPGHDPDWHLEEHPPGHRLRHYLAHLYQHAPVPRLRHRPCRSGLLLSWVGQSPCDLQRYEDLLERGLGLTIFLINRGWGEISRSQ